MIYVVIGRTGEYSDMSEWPVCWRPTLDEAKEMIATLESQAAEFERLHEAADYDADKRLDAHKRTMLDPYFARDYTGTSYFVWSVADGPEEAPRGNSWERPFVVRSAKP